MRIKFRLDVHFKTDCITVFNMIGLYYNHKCTDAFHLLCSTLLFLFRAVVQVLL